jgi:arsenate reductase
VRSGRTSYAPAAVGAYIGAAYWFTSSTSFANPAATVGRMFTDTFAGISPASVPGFVLAQLGGLLVGLALVVLFYPRRAVPASGVAAAVPSLPDRLPAAYPDLGADLGGPSLPALPGRTSRQGSSW